MFAASVSLVFRGPSASGPAENPALAAAAAFGLAEVTVILFPSCRRHPSSALAQKALIAPCGTLLAPTHGETSAAVLGKHPQWQDGSRLKTGLVVGASCCADAFFCPVFITFFKPLKSEA